MDTPTIIEYLSDLLAETRENHPSFKLMNNKIDESLFPEGIITFEAQARNSNEELKSVKGIVEDSWNKGKKNHLMIEGEGGIGKTVTLLSLPDKIAPHPVPAIYIPLHDIRGTSDEDLIERYIKTEVLEEDEELFRQLKTVRKTKWKEGPWLLLLLDGFNELPSEVLRGSVSRDIERWANYPGVQIITSSRYDIRNYVSLQSDFSKIELQRISKEKVRGYLDKVDMLIPTDATLLELITNPLLLTLHIKTEIIRSQRSSFFARFRDTKNAGTLIWNYLQCELWRFRHDRIEEAKTSILAMEFIAPYIAWKMQQQSCFSLDESVFNELLNEAHALLEAHIANPSELPSHISIILQQSNELPQISHLSLLLKEHLGIFVGFKEKDKHGNDTVRFKLMHQQFRDALAAMHLINSIYLNGNSRPTEWNSTIDHYVMQFVAELISEDEANYLWEQNRTSPQLESATRNQLELQRRLHNCDFSKLNFSGLDLSTISLYPFRIGNTMLKLPTNSNNLKEVKLSEKTFSPGGHKNSVNAVAITPDGKQIVSGSYDHTIRVWDMESGACLKIFEEHKASVNTVAITPNGRRIVSGSADKTLRVWDMESGTCLKTLRRHNKKVRAVAITPDGRRIVSGSNDGTLRIWDLESGSCLKTLKGHKDGVNAVAITQDGRRIVSGSKDNTLRVWDMESGVRLKTLKGHKNSVNAVAITLDGKRIVSGSADKILHVWDMGNGTCLRTIEGHKDGVNAVAITMDNKRIISGANKILYVWDMGSGAHLKTLDGHEGKVNAVAITPDGRRIVSGSADKTLRVWDMESGACLKTLEGHNNSVNAVAITQDGRRIVSGSRDNTLRVWDLESGAYLKTLEGHEIVVKTVAITPDGRRIVYISADHTLCVWDMESGACPIILEGHKNSVKAVAITPNGRYIVSGFSDKALRIWDMESGEHLKTLEGHENSVRAVAITPDSKRIVSGSRDNTIRVWDMETGACLKTLEGHEDWVIAVAVTTDGKRIISGSRDNTIRVWDLESREYRLTIRILPLSVVGLDFSKAEITDDKLKETLRQNGAKVDPD